MALDAKTNAKIAKLSRNAALQKLINVSVKMKEPIYIEKFPFEGKEYEVKVFLGGSEITVQAFHGKDPVSPICSCGWEKIWDYKAVHGQNVIKILVSWAREFVEDKSLEKYQQAMAELRKYSQAAIVDNEE